RFSRERPQRHAMDSRRRRQIAEDQAQWVMTADLVIAIGNDVEDWEFADAPAKKAEDLERGAVGPVGILADYDDRSGMLGEGREDRAKELFAGLAVEAALVDRQAESRGEITDHAQGTWRREGIAGEAEHVDAVGDTPAERIDQRRLANPGLAGEEDQAAIA